MAMDKKKHKKQKINTYISTEDVVRLTMIGKKYKIGSLYRVLQYLVYCFLRVVDKENDTIDEPVPAEIEEMFTNNTEWEQHEHSKHSHAGMNIKKKPDQRKYKTPDDIK